MLMIVSNYLYSKEGWKLGLTSCHITVEEAEDKIEVIGSLDANGYASNIALYINGQFQDDLYSKPKDGIFGCNIS